ncbi:hypothetical protein [Roseofilum sp. Guam]|uniref:hypothetical protein n=1 Tax=Roseofilum sp. Guam TaxID=2821502 RepID=UPI001B099867|nr:hypothetical protein [Roseofilum sp. Guam]MBP0029227.1 hypothetical protein [Roseofilum sp. Guam]
MWPNCIANIIPFRNIIPFKRTLSGRLPDFLSEGFKRHGITDPEKMYNMVNLVAILSNDEHICGSEEYWVDIGRYYWFDFDILDRDRNILPLRAVFNRRDADYDDGIWGVAWDRNTGTEVVHFRNIGRDTGEIEVISHQHIDSYQPHNLWFFDRLGSSICCSTSEEWTEPLDTKAQPSYTIYLAQSLELETLIRLVLQWCAHYIFYHLSGMIIAYRDLMNMVSKEKLCREKLGDRAENNLDRTELLGSLRLVREYDIEARFQDILCDGFLPKIYFFSKLSEDSFSIDKITNSRWRFLFYFARDYLSQYYDLEYSLTLEEEEGKFSDEVRASSDKVTRYQASYRHRFESVDELSIWFKETCCEFEETCDRINDDNIHIFFNSLSANLNSSGHPISAYQLTDPETNYVVYAIIGTLCLILVVQEQPFY